MRGIHMSDANILIDGFLLGKKSGFGRFIFELCHALGTSKTDLRFDVAVPESVDDAALKKYPNIEYLKIREFIFPIWEQFVIPYLAFKRKYSFVHFPYSTSALLVPASRRVVTVHDLTFLNRNAERDLKASVIHAYYENAFNFSTKSAKKIISVSDTTKDALSGINLNSETIYNTVDAFLSLSNKINLQTNKEKYFLHRGSPAANHRNTDRVIEAFLSKTELYENYKLKIFGVGKGHGRWGGSEAQGIEFLDRVTDEDLAKIYSNALAVVAPSILEGFCLPIIEGFGFGTAVITSRIDPMREIAGGAAILVDPLSVPEIADAMVQLTLDSQTSVDWIEKGRARIQAFSSATVAAQLLDSYQRLLH